MYPPNNFANNFPYTLDQTMPYKPSFYDINPNSKQEDSPPSSLYYNFPSPCIHYGEGDVFLQQLDDLILQHQPQIAEVNALEPIKTKMAGSEELKEECYNKRESVIKQAPRKRSSKKDRHSKIETAQGPRDRRMRLSLQVARDFFHLQDMLGYTKASKTVEWLLIKSKAAIKDLTRCSANIASSPSDCEVVSGIEEWNINSSQARNEKGKHPVSLATETKKSRGLTRKPVFNPLAKESREKARARARERVREKRKMDESKRPLEIVNREMNPLVSWSPFEKGEESSTQNHNNKPQHEILAEVGELSSSMIFNYDLPNHEIPLEHQFSDFQVFSKPWEEYNNINLRYRR